MNSYASLIEIKKTKKNSEMVRAMANDDFLVAMKARSAFAAWITEPVQQVIESTAALQQLFFPYTYEYGQPNTIPLAPFFDIRDAGFFRVWAAARSAGLATSTNVDQSEIPVMTYGVEGAVSIPMDFIRAARIDVVAPFLEHLAQNFLTKTEVNSAAVLAAMTAQTTYQLRGTATQQVLRTATQGTVIPQDISKLETLMTRVNVSNLGGTPAGASRSITTLVGSPEFGEQIRNMAFQALNTNNTNGALGGPDKFRQDIYDAGGNPSIYGMELITLLQLGINQAYNVLFANAAGAITYTGFGGGAAKIFSPGSEQVVFAINRRVRSLASLSEVSNPDTGATLSVKADNQFTNREETVGFYARRREGRVGIDGRGLAALSW